MPSPSIASEFYPPKPQWSPKEIPSQKGRIAIVTGGNSGIGLEIVHCLLRKGAKVYIAARNEAKARNAFVALHKDGETYAGAVDYLHLDLASFRSIEQFVAEISRKESRLDLLFNNAGLFLPNDSGTLSAEGVEIHMGANALGPYYLTLLLLPLLRASYKHNSSVPPRVCFTSSMGHRLASRGFDPKYPSGHSSPISLVSKQLMAYACSKMDNILMANKFQRSFANDGIIFNSCNPGNIKTSLTRNASNLSTLFLNHFINPVFLHSTELGALTPLYAGTASLAGEEGGAYFVPWARFGEPLPIALDHKVQDEMAAYFDAIIARHGRNTDIAPHPKGSWTPKEMPNLTGRIAIVTGGNTGIGFHTVEELLRQNCKVYLAARDKTRAMDAVARLGAQNLPGTLEYLQLDLARLQSIKDFSTQFLSKESKLDLLFNNAGVMLPNVGRTTADGYELQMGTNSLGHHYLTELLLPALRNAKKLDPSFAPRVCFTSSIGHHFASSGPFNPEDVSGMKASRLIVLPEWTRAYGASKLANIWSAKWFQRHYGDKEGMLFTSVHPGNLRTELTRDYRGLTGLFMPIISFGFLYPSEMGAYTQLYANTSPEATEGGAYYVPWARKIEPSAISHDEKSQEACMS
ncbi:hypothetical protein MVES1_002954 [Malassezia vespertilionis]|uniref:uncharacterized protein n=1 Tax=Malassezia vespertilionis TaxID=2020962 RepID=UPI0024B1D173|nr:uncharacterized protein MVES1_002954 [Malassezia vespertilionis]WFD07587.1 hypothetical protein MVES1_002954 [Malassezia vespertilionis]